MRGLIICTAAASVLLGACTKDIDYNLKDIKPQLIVNSQMTVGDTLHLVYLAVSKSDRVERICTSTATTIETNTIKMCTRQDPTPPARPTRPDTRSRPVSSQVM